MTRFVVVRGADSPGCWWSMAEQPWEAHVGSTALFSVLPRAPSHPTALHLFPSVTVDGSGRARDARSLEEGPAGPRAQPAALGLWASSLTVEPPLTHRCLEQRLLRAVGSQSFLSVSQNSWVVPLLPGTRKRLTMCLCRPRVHSGLHTPSSTGRGVAPCWTRSGHWRPEWFLKNEPEGCC